MSHEHSKIEQVTPTPEQGEINPDLESAERTLNQIKGHVREVDPAAGSDDVDEAVAEFVGVADGTDNNKIEGQAADVGVVELRSDSNAWRTALSILRLPLDKVAAALRKMKPDDADKVTAVIDNVDHTILEQPPTDMADFRQPETVEGLEQLDRETELSSAIDSLRTLREQTGIVVAKHGPDIGRSRMGSPIGNAMWRIAELVQDSEDCKLATISAAIKELDAARQYDASTRLMQERAHNPDAVARLDHRVLNLIDNTPLDVLQRMYQSSDPEESGALRYVLKRALEDESQGGNHRENAAKAIARASGHGSIRGLVADQRKEGAEHTQGKLLDALMAKPEIVAQAMLSEYWEISPAEGQSLHEARKEFAVEFLRDNLGLPAELVKTMTYAMKGRVADDPLELNPTIAPTKHLQELGNIMEHVNRFGAEGLVRLHEQMGVVNFGKRSQKKLEFMLKVIDRDDETLGNMRSKEVIMAIEDATEDWNGAFRSTETTFDGGDDGTMIPFEVESLADDAAELGRYIDFMEERGLRPSVVILSGHGAPGSLRMGDGHLANRDVAQRLVELGRAGAPFVDINRSSIIRRLFAFMKPDKEHKCHVFLDSCSQASAATVAGDPTVDVVARVLHESNQEGENYVYASPVTTSVARRAAGELSFTSADAVIVTVDDAGNVVSTSKSAVSIPALKKKIDHPDIDFI